MNDHAVRVYKALKYIDQNLFAQIDLESIANAGAFSPFHFHRLFTSLMGINVGDYVRKRKLNEASRRILHTDQDILDLALECQYESQEAFTRAFKKMYDITPGQLRKVKKSIEIERLLTLDDINQLVKGEIMQPKIIKLRSKRIMGLAYASKEGNYEAAYEQWGIFMNRLTEIPGRNMDVLLGLTLESHPDIHMAEKDRFIYVSGVEVSQDDVCPEGLIEINIPETTYVKFIHHGHVIDFANTNRQIWNNWIPEGKFVVTDGPQIEVYGEKFNLESAESEIEILVPILK